MNTGGRQHARKPPENVTFNRKQTNKYCWTHGGCNHTSSECNARANGHKENATFDDRKGGSNAFCPTWKRERVRVSNVIKQFLLNQTCSSPKHTTTRRIVVKGNSGATTHYIGPQDAAVLQHVSVEQGLTVHQQDNTEMRAIASGELPLSTKLSTTAKEAYSLPNLWSLSLIALGKLCNDDCKVVLMQDDLVVIKDEDIILKGKRNRTDNLWDIPIEKTQLTANNYMTPGTNSGMYMRKRTKPLTKSQLILITKSTRNKKNKTPMTNVNNMSRRAFNKIIRAQLKKMRWPHRISKRYT